MREIVHIQAGQCGNQIGTKVRPFCCAVNLPFFNLFSQKYLKLVTSKLSWVHEGSRFVSPFL